MLHERIYLDQDDDRVYIDTYVANYKNKKRDAVLVIPGGGYGAVCTDREGEPIALAYLAQGLNAFVLNYRVGKAGDHYPKQLVDAGRAIMYIKSHADEFSVNPDRVFTVGFSAGGHLSGLCAIMYGDPEVKEILGITGDENKPRGAVLSYPVVTAMTERTHKPSFANLLGKNFEDITDEEKARFSLECRVTAESAPAFIWHTSRDSLVPLDGSLMLTRAYVLAGHNVETHIYPYGPHGLALANQITARDGDGTVQPLAEDWVADSVKWMKTIL